MGKTHAGSAAGVIGERFAQTIMRQGAGARREVFQQLNEALSTGNIEAKIPVIQSMVESGLQQGSQALRVADEDIAKSGAGRSPAAAEMRASLRAMASDAVSQIPGAVIGQTLAEGPGAIQGATGAGLSLLGVAQQASAAGAAASAQNQATAVGAGGAGAAAAIAIIAAI